MFLGSVIFHPGGWQISVTKEEALKLFLILIGTPLNQRLQILAEHTGTHLSYCVPDRKRTLTDNNGKVEGVSKDGMKN